MNELPWDNKEQDETIHTHMAQPMALHYSLEDTAYYLLPITDDPLPLSTLKKCPIAAEKNDTQLVCRLYCPFGRSGSVTGATAVELPLISSDRFFFLGVVARAVQRRCKYQCVIREEARTRLLTKIFPLAQPSLLLSSLTRTRHQVTVRIDFALILLFSLSSLSFSFSFFFYYSLHLLSQN